MPTMQEQLAADVILNSITEAARQALQAMNPANYEYQSDFAKRFVAEGKAEGKAELAIKLLTLKFGAQSDAVQARIRTASSADLDLIGERVLTAKIIDEVLGPH